MDDLLTVGQAADLLGITPNAVRTAIQQGRLPATKLGPRAILIKRSDAEAYKTARKHAGGRPRKADTQPQ